MNEIGIIRLLPEEVVNYHRELRQMVATQFGLDGVADPGLPAHLNAKYRFPVEKLDGIEKALESCESRRQVPLRDAPRSQSVGPLGANSDIEPGR